MERVFMKKIICKNHPLSHYLKWILSVIMTFLMILSTSMIIWPDNAIHAMEKTTEEAVEEAAEKAVEKAKEKEEKEEAEKAELTARRPDEWRGPTKIYFLIFVLDIDEIDDANQNFMSNVYLQLRWKDERLAVPGVTTRQLPLEDIWNPRILISNRQGLVSRSLPEVAQVYPDGTVYYRQRYSGRLSQPLTLKDFPMDSHTFFIHFVAAGYRGDELSFLPEEGRGPLSGGAMAEELSLPDWEILNFKAIALPYKPIEGVNNAGCAFIFEAKRYSIYYLWQIILPLVVVVFMSWAAFWIGPHHIGVRIGVATSSILTLIANRFLLANLLPRLPYMTRLDYFTVGSTLLVFLALLTVILTAFLEEKKADKITSMIDLAARIVFPAIYLLFFIWFVRN